MALRRIHYWMRALHRRMRPPLWSKPHAPKWSPGFPEKRPALTSQWSRSLFPPQNRALFPPQRRALPGWSRALFPQHRALGLRVQRRRLWTRITSQRRRHMVRTSFSKVKIMQQTSTNAKFGYTLACQTERRPIILQTLRWIFHEQEGHRCPLSCLQVSSAMLYGALNSAVKVKKAAAASKKVVAKKTDKAASELKKPTKKSSKAAKKGEKEASGKEVDNKPQKPVESAARKPAERPENQLTQRPKNQLSLQPGNQPSPQPENRATAWPQNRISRPAPRSPLHPQVPRYLAQRLRSARLVPLPSLLPKCRNWAKTSCGQAVKSGPLSELMKVRTDASLSYAFRRDRRGAGSYA